MARRKVTKRTEALPPKVFTGEVVPATAFKIKELPHLTFYGSDTKDLEAKVRAHLTRSYPEGYSVEAEEFDANPL